MQNYSLKTLKSLGDPWLGNSMHKTGLGLIVDCKLNMSQHHIVAAKIFHLWDNQSIIRNIILNCQKRSILFYSDQIQTICPVFVQWQNGFKREQLQRKTTGMIRRFVHHWPSIFKKCMSVFCHQFGKPPVVWPLSNPFYITTCLLFISFVNNFVNYFKFWDFPQHSSLIKIYRQKH